MVTVRESSIGIFPKYEINLIYFFMMIIHFRWGIMICVMILSSYIEIKV